jgi:xylulose-5-phosphate/fructose-6-phosphate phosphoketolase
VRGYKEEGTTTTPFDMCVLNEIDRYSLAIDAIDRVPQLMSSAAHVRQELVDKIIEHKHYIRRYGEDMPKIAGWMWHASDGEKASLVTDAPGVIATAGDNV